MKSSSDFSLWRVIFVWKVYFERDWKRKMWARPYRVEKGGREGGVAWGSLTCFYCCCVETSKPSAAAKKIPFFQLATSQLGCGPRSCNKRKKFSGFYMNSVLSTTSLFLCSFVRAGTWLVSSGGTLSELSCLSDVISCKILHNWYTMIPFHRL